MFLVVLQAIINQLVFAIFVTTLAWETSRHFATPPWFPREMTSEKRAQKLYTDDASLPRSGWCYWLASANFQRGTTNQKNYSDLGSDVSSVWNHLRSFLRRHFAGKPGECREMSAVFPGYRYSGRENFPLIRSQVMWLAQSNVNDAPELCQ